MNTIAAIATANSAGGVGMVRISGEDAIKIADRVFHGSDGRPLKGLPGYCARFGHVFAEGKKLDQAIALVFREPRSYTGEDVVELSCHGGLYLVGRMLEAIFAAGAAPAQPGEFTKRAYLNGKMDLTSAESVMQLISASGAQAAAASLSQLEGALYREITEVRDALLDCSANLAAWVDYPDDEIPELEEAALSSVLGHNRARLAALLARSQQGQAVLEGVDTVIAGRPNAGKSTLMNLLSGKEKSIVTDLPGTTRDIVEDTVRLGNLVLRLSDTAGLRQSSDAVESIGIRRAYHKIRQAQLILAVFDASQPLNEEDCALVDQCSARTAIAVINKTDLPSCIETERITAAFPKTVMISAGSGQGLADLTAAAEELLGTAAFDAGAPLLAGERQCDCCRKALAALEEAETALAMGITYDAVNVSLDGAIEALLRLTGEKITEAVADQVFANFCVGK